MDPQKQDVHTAMVAAFGFPRSDKVGMPEDVSFKINALIRATGHTLSSDRALRAFSESLSLSPSITLITNDITKIADAERRPPSTKKVVGALKEIQSNAERLIKVIDNIKADQDLVRCFSSVAKLVMTDHSKILGILGIHGAYITGDGPRNSEDLTKYLLEHEFLPFIANFRSLDTLNNFVSALSEIARACGALSKQPSLSLSVIGGMNFLHDSLAAVGTDGPLSNRNEHFLPQVCFGPPHVQLLASRFSLLAAAAEHNLDLAFSLYATMPAPILPNDDSGWDARSRALSPRVMALVEAFTNICRIAQFPFKGGDHAKLQEFLSERRNDHIKWDVVTAIVNHETIAATLHMFGFKVLSPETIVKLSKLLNDPINDNRDNLLMTIAGCVLTCSLVMVGSQKSIKETDAILVFKELMDNCDLLLSWPALVLAAPILMDHAISGEKVGHAVRAAVQSYRTGRPSHGEIYLRIACDGITSPRDFLDAAAVLEKTEPRLAVEMLAASDCAERFWTLARKSRKTSSALTKATRGMERTEKGESALSAILKTFPEYEETINFLRSIGCLNLITKAGSQGEQELAERLLSDIYYIEPERLRGESAVSTLKALARSPRLLEQYLNKLREASDGQDSVLDQMIARSATNENNFGALFGALGQESGNIKRNLKVPHSKPETEPSKHIKRFVGFPSINPGIVKQIVLVGHGARRLPVPEKTTLTNSFGAAVPVSCAEPDSIHALKASTLYIICTGWIAHKQWNRLRHSTTRTDTAQVVLFSNGGTNIDEFLDTGVRKYKKLKKQE